MSAKKWLVCFVCILMAAAAAVAAFNYVTDPFGVFGEPVLGWDSYNMTMNPRASKIAYLDQHYQEYDSYIIGCSSSSAYPTEALNRYFGGRFYNMIMYGVDMLDVEQTAAYAAEHYTVKNLVISLYIDNGRVYGYESDPLANSLLPRVDGSPAVPYYLRFLFSDPVYGMEKLKAMTRDTWLQQSFDVFVPEEGCYDKSRRDAEPIGSLDRYTVQYPEFLNYPQASYDMPHIADCVRSLQRIVELCEQKGINLTVVMNPVYWEYMAFYERAEVEAFYTALAEVHPFWDFSYSSVSFEPRYFYDRTHMRNSVGEMALARIAGDENLYIPEDFGALVTADNVAGHIDRIYGASALPEEDYTAQVPVLMYHHLDETVNGNSTIVTPERFEEHIRALTEAGYTAVTSDDLQNYVNHGTALPEKPVVITFDDGYRSNYTHAFPILKQYGQKATIFAIGVSLGKDTYKDTGMTITPHFTGAEAREMVESGLIQVQSHTYDMHQVAQYDGEDARRGVLQLEGESESDYIAALRADLDRSREQLEQAAGEVCDAIAYPYGFTAELTNTVVADEGFLVSYSIEEGTNTIVRGLPQSLYGLMRYTAVDTMTGQDLLAMIEQ